MTAGTGSRPRSHEPRRGSVSTAPCGDQEAAEAFLSSSAGRPVTSPSHRLPSLSASPGGPEDLSDSISPVSPCLYFRWSRGRPSEVFATHRHREFAGRPVPRSAGPRPKRLRGPKRMYTRRAYISGFGAVKNPF